jgi:hypothetical protein
MNPNQFQTTPSVSLANIIPESQTLSFPKIDHILAHAKHPELSKIYARPELQASASASGQDDPLGLGHPSTGKKTRKNSKRQSVYEKKSTGKSRKSEIYEKYYLDEARLKKVTPIKKVSVIRIRVFIV